MAYLFRCFAIEMFAVGLRIGAGMMDNAVSMIRRRINRIEFQRNVASIDNVVIRPRRDDNCEARSNRSSHTIENRLAGSFFDTKELIERVDFGPDFLVGIQRHEDELTVFRRVNHPAEIFILVRQVLNVLDKAFHNKIPPMNVGVRLVTLHSVSSGSNSRTNQTPSSSHQMRFPLHP
jgi:hypothetical protein